MRVERLKGEKKDMCVHVWEKEREGQRERERERERERKNYEITKGVCA